MSQSTQSTRSISPAFSQDLLTAQDAELRRCSRCHNYKFAVHFAGRIEDYHTCDRCRARQSTVGQGVPEEGRISFDEFVESLPSRYITDSTDAGEVDVQYSFHAYISMDAEMVAMEDLAIIDSISSSIESVDGYRYHLINVAHPMKKHAVAFYLGCTQDESIQRQVADRQRLSRMETFPCSGRVTGEIDRRNHQIMIDIQHDPGHCQYAVQNRAVPHGVREFIRDNALSYDASALFSRVRLQFPKESRDVTQAQRRHEDQLVSSKILLQEAYVLFIYAVSVMQVLSNLPYVPGYTVWIG
ncbi:hypothetical protein BX666DRAFT_1969168 [Dichotomocladium elegans]|nr:hypothetical protein BX666DRAFT_1969168 [Dichotomocladium elegans]